MSGEHSVDEMVPFGIEDFEKVRRQMAVQNECVCGHPEADHDLPHVLGPNEECVCDGQDGCDAPGCVCVHYRPPLASRAHRRA